MLRAALLLAVLFWMVLVGPRLGIREAMGEDLADPADPTHWTGKRVTQIELTAPKGVDEGDLRYLIEQQVGELYDPVAIQRSVALLFRLDRWDDVQVLARPDGAAGVALRVVLVPSPVLRAIRLPGLVQTVPPHLQSAARASLGKAPGDPWTSGDEERMAQDLSRWLRSEGWLDAVVAGRVERTLQGGLVVTLSVEGGARYHIAGHRFPGGTLAVWDERRLAEFVPRELRRGAVWREGALQDGVRAIVASYREGGFLEARLLTVPGPGGAPQSPVSVQADRDRKTVTLLIPVEPGPYVETRFEFQGPRPTGLGDEVLRRALGLQDAQSVSQAFVEDSKMAILRLLRDRGRYHARVAVSMQEEVEPDFPKAVAAWRLPRVDHARRLVFQIEAGPLARLAERDIEFRGNAAIPRQGLLQVLWDASPRVLGHRERLWEVLGVSVYTHLITDDEVAAASEVLGDVYRARGFPEAQITWAITPVPPADGGLPRRFKLDFEIQEGELWKVRSLDIEGAPDRVMDGAAHWKASLVGKPVNPPQIEEVAAELKDAMADLGYVDAEVEVVRTRVEGQALIDVLLRARPGTEVRFGAVIVRENRNTHLGLIQQEVRGTGMGAGQRFRPKAMGQAQERLLRSGLFDSVVLLPAQDSGRVRDVEVVLNERDRFSASVGVGVSWPDDGPRLSGEMRLRNLDGRGLSLWARGKVGRDWDFWANPDLTLGWDYRASLGLDFPYIPGIGAQASLVGVLGEQIEEPTYRIDRSSVSLTVSVRRPLWTLDARVEWQRRSPLRIDSVARLHPTADQPVASVWKDAEQLVLGGLSLGIDRRDDRWNPTRGVFATIGLDSTFGDLIPGSPAFGRLSGRAVGFVPLGPDVGLQLELGGGVAWSYDGHPPPVEWRFRLGGTTTVRAFALDAIGPSGDRPGTLQSEGLLVGDSLPGRRVPVGGDVFYRYSIQVHLPMPRLGSLKFVLFHDAGNALLYDTVRDGLENNKARILEPSVGLGLRRPTPIGPLRLDLGLRPWLWGDVARGAAAFTDSVRVHFAVGAL